MYAQAPWRLSWHVAVSCLVWALGTTSESSEGQELHEHLGAELAHTIFKTQSLIGQELAEDLSWNHRPHIKM